MSGVRGVRWGERDERGDVDERRRDEGGNLQDFSAFRGVVVFVFVVSVCYYEKRRHFPLDVASRVV